MVEYEKISPSILLVGRHAVPQFIYNRIGLGLAGFFGWLSDKSRQITAFAADDDLVRAVFAASKAPVEGSRYRVGETISVHHRDGRRTRLKICGFQSGGFSNVYTVIDLDEMRPYCLKENRATPGDEFTKNRKLGTEAEISLLLDPHPNLVTTFEAFFIRNRLSILTEYIPAAGLEAKLKLGRLPLQESLRYGVDICRAVGYAQAALPGFVHGDIKPGNCLITDDGSLKLSDFGLSSYRSSVGVSEVNDSAGWGGTTAYMAPEMFRVEDQDRSHADIYALGVTLYEMITGACPFYAASKSEIARLHLEVRPDLTKLDDFALPTPVKEVIAQCLEKSPDDRPTSFAAVEQILRRACDDLSIALAARDAPPLDDAEMSRRALSFAVLGDPGLAAARIDCAIRQSGPSAEMLACKAVALAETHPEEAYASSTAALMTQSELFVVLFAHARVLLRRGDPDNAAEYLHRALRLRPDNCAALNLLGDINLQFGQFDEASVYLRRSLAIDGSQPEPYERLAEINRQLGRYDAAIRFVGKALALDPRRPGSHRVLGDVFQTQKRLVDAVNSFKSAHRFDPSSKIAARLYVRACFELCSAKGLEIDRQIVNIILRGTRVFTHPARDISAAFAREFTDLIRRSTFDPTLLFCLDHALAGAVARLDPDSADRFIANVRPSLAELAERRLPPYVTNSLGRILYEFGEYEKCQSVFQRFLERFGPDENAFYYLGACFEIKEDFATARGFYKKAQRLELSEDARTGIMRTSAMIEQRKHLRRSPVGAQ